jgi:hypothetical protein
MRHRRAAAIMSSASIIVFLGAACGSDNSSSPTVATTARAVTTSATTTATSASRSSGPSGSASPELCAERDALKQSIQNLTNVNVVRDGTSGLQAALTDVRNQLQSLRTSARGELQPQVQDFDEALSNLDTAIRNVTANGLDPVVTAARDAAEAGSTLLTALDNLDC